MVHGFSQQHNVDYDETFSLVLKPATIHIVLSIVASRRWPMHQLNLKNAFLMAILRRPSTTSSHPTSSTCQRLTWFGSCRCRCMVSSRLLEHGISRLPRTSSIMASLQQSSPCLFIYKDQYDDTYLMLYINDIVLTASSPTLLRCITDRLNSKFAMKDLDALHHILAISVTRSSHGLLLSQQQYTIDLL